MCAVLKKSHGIELDAVTLHYLCEKLLLYCVEGDGCLDYGEGVNAFERNVFRLKALVLAYKTNVVRTI